MSNDTEEEKGMDPVIISSLVMLSTNIINLALKYSDPNIVAPAIDDVKARLVEFEKLAPLPETYDEDFVNNAMDYIKDLIGGMVD